MLTQPTPFNPNWATMPPGANTTTPPAPQAPQPSGMYSAINSPTANALIAGQRMANAPAGPQKGMDGMQAVDAADKALGGKGLASMVGAGGAGASGGTGLLGVLGGL